MIDGAASKRQPIKAEGEITQPPIANEKVKRMEWVIFLDAILFSECRF